MRKLASLGCLMILTTSLCFADIFGTWKGSMDMSKLPISFQSGKADIKAPKLLLVIKKDGTYERIAEQPTGGKVTRIGTWKRNGKELVLTSSESSPGKQAGKPQVLTIGDGEKTLIQKVQGRVGMGTKPTPGAKPLEMTIVFKR
jgi:hypothetical protein